MLSDVAKSALNFSWAMSLLGIRQMTNLMNPEDTKDPMNKVSETFDAITEVVEGQLGNTLKEAYKAGENLQDSVLDMSGPLFKMESFDPSQIMQVPVDMMNRVSDTFTKEK